MGDPLPSLATPFLSSGAVTPTGSGVDSPVHPAGASGPVRRTSSWGGGLLPSPSAVGGGGGGGGDDDGGGGGTRKPGQPVRETRARRTLWTVINSHGVKSTMLSDKRGIIQRFRLGVPIRDMRLMDAAIFAPDAAVILVRDNAIVLRIEHVRLIVTADEVVLPQDGAVDAAGARFGGALLEAVLDAAAEARARADRAGGSDDDGGGTPPRAGSPRATRAAARASVSAAPHEPDPLPFELHVLEAALREVAASAAAAVKELDAVATPALDALTRAVSTVNLERVRKIKTRHQRLLARVQSLREELQGFLDDDADMFRMCLTRRADAERAAAAAAAAPPPTALGGLSAALGGGGSDAVPPLRSSAIYGTSFGRRPSLSLGGGPGRLGTPGPGGAAADAAAAAADAADDDAEALETVENLLESYFMQVDASYDRLVSMDEYIKDTEEYINIELDSARNRLIKLEIVVTAGTFGLGIWSLVAGVLGENLVIPGGERVQSVGGFVAINAGAALAAAAAFMGIMGYIKYMRLL